MSAESRLATLEECVYGTDYSEADLSLVGRVDVLERRVHDLERPRLSRSAVLERVQQLSSDEMAEVIAVADRLQELLGLGRR